VAPLREFHKGPGGDCLAPLSDVVRQPVGQSPSPNHQGGLKGEENLLISVDENGFSIVKRAKR
jgi:hypothetical protein